MRETIRLLRLAATASAVIGFAVNLIALWQVSITRHFGAPLVPRALFAWAFLPVSHSRQTYRVRAYLPEALLVHHGKSSHSPRQADLQAWHPPQYLDHH